MSFRFKHTLPLFGLLALAACGGTKDANNLSELDAQLANSVDDPALRGALEDQIAVDPDMVDKSNARAVRPGERPLSGGVPFTAADRTAALAQATRIAGGKIEAAPAPTQAEPCKACGGQPPRTLGALARNQGKTATACGNLAYDPRWAQRLPQGLPLYPGARLMEAAGVEGGKCGLRAASFVAPVPLKEAIDFYYTVARRSGYDAEHQMMDGGHVLGGTRARDDSAYFFTFASVPGGTSIDLIASGGR